MSSMKPAKAKSNSRRKKLKLSKETLKDLAVKNAQVKGGQAMFSYQGPCSF